MQGALKAYPTHRAIVISHYLLNADGNFGTYGSDIHNALKGNSNLFLMLCGHMAGEATRMNIYSGNTVYTLLADYQGRSNGGDGCTNVMLQRFIIATLDDTTEFKVKVNVKGNVRVAIYADSSNIPDALLRANTSKVWFDTYPV
jgi:hypothetical protein